MAEGFAERAGFPLPGIAPDGAPGVGAPGVGAPGVAPDAGRFRVKPHTADPARPPVFASIGPHGHRQRMRERLLARGPESLADYEVLEMLLFLGIRRGDTKPLAKAAINRFGSLRGVLLASVEDLGDVFHHHTRAVAPVLKLVVLAADRLARAEARDRLVMRDWDGLDGYLASSPVPDGAGRARVLFLNNRNQLLADEVLDAAPEDPVSLPRETVRRALALHATALILVLGRAGKSGTPTKAEVASAARLKQAAGVLSIGLHDVLLSGAGGRTSLRRKGML